MNIRVHPIYKNYGYNMETKQIVHMPTNREVRQQPLNSGYSGFMGSSPQVKGQKMCFCHRFIWECCNDIIPSGYEIDHMNKNKLDNTIKNLRCITMQENRKSRDHTNIIKNAALAHKLKRCIKAISMDNDESFCFKSKNQCGKYFDISAAMVYLICENMYRCANTNKGKFRFEYVDEKDLENLVEIPHGRLGKVYKNKNSIEK